MLAGSAASMPQNVTFYFDTLLTLPMLAGEVQEKVHKIQRKYNMTHNMTRNETHFTVDHF